MSRALLSDVIRRTFSDSILDYDSEIIIKKERANKKEITKLSTHTTMLCNLQHGREFRIGDLDFIKLETFKDGTTMVLLISDEYEKYGETVDYLKSNVRNILHNKMLPIIENNIGAVYIKEHYTDYTPLQRESGRVFYSKPDFGKSLILERIGLLSYHDYKKYKDFIPKELRYGWLSNCLDCPNNFVFVMNNEIWGLRKCFSPAKILPVITVDSSRIVKTRVLLTYSV